MTISLLEIHNFRNILYTNIQPCPRINIFYGQNGSGKTSILEALYCLGLGRSFRTRHIKRTINDTSDRFALFIQIDPFANGNSIPVGVERYRNGSNILRVAEKTAQSQLDVADILPLQFINSESHRLLTGGPLTRRQYLDWGVFHQENNFYPLWQRLQRSLKQRNAAIKAKQLVKQIQLWDVDIVTTSAQLDIYRHAYFTSLGPVFEKIIHSFLPGFAINLKYYRGWDETKDLAFLLNSNFARDMQLGYTQFGAQKADIFIQLENLPAQEILSQGQQKLVAYALRLSQGILLNHFTSKKSLYLIDDLPAELDDEKRALIAELLVSMDCQVFVTGINPSDLRDLYRQSLCKMFHVEHGKTSTVQPHEF